MTLYIGVDIHARQQTLSYLDTSDGTTGVVELSHERDDIKQYYSQFQGDVIIGTKLVATRTGARSGLRGWATQLNKEVH